MYKLKCYCGNEILLLDPLPHIVICEACHRMYLLKNRAGRRWYIYAGKANF